VFGELLPPLRGTNSLAVAVIIGGAIGKVVTSVVSDLLMPGDRPVARGGDWRAWRIVLAKATRCKLCTSAV